MTVPPTPVVSADRARAPRRRPLVAAPGWIAARRRRPRSAFNTTATVFTSFSVAGFAGWAVLQHVGADRSNPFAQLVSATPYTAVASLTPVAVALGLRRWRLTGVAVLVAAVLGGGVLPRALPAHLASAPAEASTLRVLSTNVELGKADARAVVDLARQENAAVLSVQELTDRIVARLRAAGIDQLFPYHSLKPGEGALGTGLWSRYPMTESGQVSRATTFSMATGTIEVGGHRVQLVAAHPAPPIPEGIDRWRRDYSELPTAPAEDADAVRVLAGDFNATLDHSLFRRLRDSGYRDAADDLGDGLRNTWPSDRRVGVVIDHVLAGPAPKVQMLAYRVHAVPDTDHRAIFAEIALL
jgi:endonuclease/exonuclease/phosphatase (EEP) superfamily protein YafD